MRPIQRETWGDAEDIVGSRLGYFSIVGEFRMPYSQFFSCIENLSSATLTRTKKSDLKSGVSAGPFFNDNSKKNGEGHELHTYIRTQNSRVD